MYRALASVALSISLLFGQVGFSGELPKQTTYNYTYYGETTAAPVAYEFSEVFGGEELELSGIKGLSDLCVDNDGNVYLIDSIDNRVIKIDEQYNLIQEKKQFIYGEEVTTLKTAEGICFGKDGYIYIADTGNGRILKCNCELEILKIYGAPDKETAQYDFEYLPSKVAVDVKGRLYVVAKSQTQGIFKLDSEGNFIGFIGASKVKTSLTQLIYRLFASREQLKGMLQFIPTEYSNITMDSDGFLYGIISAVDGWDVLSDVNSKSNNVKPVRRLNQSGEDITITEGTFAPLGDLDFTVDNIDSYAGSSVFVDVASSENGVYSILDSRRGRVFTYNQRSELMYIFGNRGSENGSFINPVALEYQDDKILVADKSNGTVQVFIPTDYAKKITLGNAQYVSGDYEAEAETWKEVLTLYPGSDLANVGVGRALYNQGEYEDALEYFKKAQNRTYYSKALKYYIREKGAEAVPYIVGTLVILVVALFILKKINKKRRKLQLSNNSRFKKLLREIRYAQYIAFHPFDGFWDLKSEHRGSVLSATMILIMAVIVNIVHIRLTPFLFNTTDFTQTSALIDGSLGIIALVILWVICNWALTTIMNGKGTMKDIYKYTCYSLWPMVILYPIVTVVSYFLTVESASFITMLSAVALVWVIFLIFSGTLSTHQYSATKTVITMLLTVVAMMIVVFVLMLTISLVQQILSFATLLIREVFLSL